MEIPADKTGVYLLQVLLHKRHVKGKESQATTLTSRSYLHTKSMALLGHQTVLVQRNSQGNSAAVSADGQSSSESKQHPDAPASPEQQPFKREAHGSSSPKERQLEPDELSRCTTPPRLGAGQFASGQ